MDDFIPIAFGVAFVLFIVVAVVQGRARARALRQLYAEGRRAKGLILEMSPTGSSMSADGQNYELRDALFDVEEEGVEPYEVRGQVIIPKMLVSGALPGTFFELRVSPAVAGMVAIVGPGGVYFAD